MQNAQHDKNLRDNFARNDNKRNGKSMPSYAFVWPFDMFHHSHNSVFSRIFGVGPQRVCAFLQRMNGIKRLEIGNRFYNEIRRRKQKKKKEIVLLRKNHSFMELNSVFTNEVRVHELNKIFHGLSTITIYQMQ